MSGGGALTQLVASSSSIYGLTSGINKINGYAEMKKKIEEKCQKQCNKEAHGYKKDQCVYQCTSSLTVQTLGNPILDYSVSGPGFQKCCNN